MAATRVNGTTSQGITPWFTYEVTANTATTYTLKLNLGVNIRGAGIGRYSMYTTESYLSKKIGSGSAAFTYASSSARLNNSGDTTIIANSSWSITKTHSTQSITVLGLPYLDHTPIGSAMKTLTVPAKTSYTVTYNANSGSGAPAQQTKWYNETLTLSSAKPTKAGYTFNGWATSEANAKAGTVAYAPGASYTGNAALTLWAVWELTYSKPTITNLHAERCDVNGNADDEGTIAKVTFDWAVFRSSSTRYYGGNTTPYTSTTVQSCSVQVGTVTKSVSLSGASGSASVIVGSTGSFLTDTQYTATVTLTDTVDSEVQPTHSSTASATLATTFFPMDFNANASAVGFFRPAPDDGDGMYLGKALYLKDGLLQAHVIESGTVEVDANTHWTYRKWSNGIVEEWGSKEVSGTFTAWAPLSYFDVTISGEPFATGDIIYRAVSGSVESTTSWTGGLNQPYQVRFLTNGTPSGSKSFHAFVYIVRKVTT